jgi:recombination protein RecA
MAKEKSEKVDNKLDTALEALNKKYGKGTVIPMAGVPTEPIEVTSTGSIGLDKATGVGGMADGKILECFGQEASGKTTLLVQVLANGQKKPKNKDRKALVIDYEHAFDWKYAEALGLTKENTIFAQPDNGEEGFEIIKALLPTGMIFGFLFDSIAAAIPKEMHDGETNHSRMARLASMMSQELIKVAVLCDNHDCLGLFTNQIRANNFSGYGNPNNPAGGNAMKFYATMRWSVARIVEKEDQTNKITVTVIKNKVAPPFGTAEFYLDWGKGVNRDLELLDEAIELGHIKLGGSWYTVGDQKIQGSDKVIQFLKDNPEFYAELEAKVVAGIALPKEPAKKEGIPIGDVQTQD